MNPVQLLVTQMQRIGSDHQRLTIDHERLAGDDERLMEEVLGLVGKEPKLVSEMISLADGF